MNFKGKLLSVAPMLAGSIEAIAMEPRPQRRHSNEAGSRIGYATLTGVLEPDYLRDFRSQLNRHRIDPSVRAVAVYANSGGGLCDGSPETAEVVRRVAAEKPIHFIAEGYLCSAAYFIACQATTIAASPSTVVGSIGTIMALSDSSEFWAGMGVKIITVATGVNKACGYSGVPVTDSHIKMLQQLVDGDQAAFESAIERGRHLKPKQMIEVSDGSVWGAARAKRLGLIDSVEQVEDAFAELESANPPEQYASLRGRDALAKYEELAMIASRQDPDLFDLEDVPAATLAKLQAEYPTLAKAVAEYRASLPHYTSRR